MTLINLKMQFGSICNFNHFLKKIWWIHLRTHQVSTTVVSWVSGDSIRAQFTQLHHCWVTPVQLQALLDSHRLNILCVPQPTVQKWSSAASSAAFPTWFSCSLLAVRAPPTPAAPATPRWRPQRSRVWAAATTPASIWTVGCSAPARMLATVWSWLWRFRKSATIRTSRNGGTVKNHSCVHSTVEKRRMFAHCTLACDVWDLPWQKLVMPNITDLLMLSTDNDISIRKKIGVGKKYWKIWLFLIKRHKWLQ